MLLGEINLPVKYEQEQKENCLNSFDGIPVFIEFIKSIGFDRICIIKIYGKQQSGISPLHYLLTLVLINTTSGESVSNVDCLEVEENLTIIT